MNTQDALYHVDRMSVANRRVLFMMWNHPNLVMDAPIRQFSAALFICNGKAREECREAYYHMPIIGSGMGIPTIPAILL